MSLLCRCATNIPLPGSRRTGHGYGRIAAAAVLPRPGPEDRYHICRSTGTAVLPPQVRRTDIFVEAQERWEPPQVRRTDIFVEAQERWEPPQVRRTDIFVEAQERWEPPQVRRTDIFVDAQHRWE